MRAYGSDEAFDARQLLITNPAGVWQAEAISFDSPLTHKVEAAKRLASGQVIRVSLRFRTAFRERLWDFSLLHTLDRDFPTWWGTYPVRSTLLTGWEGGPREARLSDDSSDQLLEKALASLARVLRTTHRTVHDEFICAWTHNWQTDPFARGAYSYVPAGATDANAALAEPIGNTLYFAGEATHTAGMTGTVHGAIGTGHRAASEILRDLRQSPRWR
jgi:monoamine oxidase